MSEAKPVITDVVIEPWDGDGEGKGYLSVDPVWSGVDRPRSGGWVVKDRRTANRLAAALKAGVALTVEGVGTDVSGQTYVQTRSHVLARIMNADLTRLGF